MDMETDGPVLDDVNQLKKTVEEEATQVDEYVYTAVWGRCRARQEMYVGMLNQVLCPCVPVRW